MDAIGSKITNWNWPFHWCQTCCCAIYLWPSLAMEQDEDTLELWPHLYVKAMVYYCYVRGKRLVIPTTYMLARSVSCCAMLLSANALAHKAHVHWDAFVKYDHFGVVNSLRLCLHSFWCCQQPPPLPTIILVLSTATAFVLLCVF